MSLKAWISALLCTLAWVLFVLVMVVVCCKPAHAYEFADKWNWKDSVLEGVFAFEVAIDLGQTLYASENPKDYYEWLNPFLPKHPAKNQVWEACIGGAVLHVLISLALPKHLYIKDFDLHPRSSWQGTTITLEGANDIHNKAIGIQMKF
jgi:hypothetical protein